MIVTRNRMAALWTAVAVATALPAGAVLAQTTTVPQPAAQRPDPAIAVGMEVFNGDGVSLGRIQDVVTHNGAVLAVMTEGGVLAQPSRLIAVPYEKLTVNNGMIRLNESWGAFAGRPTFAYGAGTTSQVAQTRR